MHYLSDWQNFYIIIGSAAAGLTGLMFVVITFIKSVRNQVPGIVISTFSTPTIVHFSLVFAISSILSAPWEALSNLIFLLCFIALGGVIYVVIVANRMRRPIEIYTPVMEDWIWYVILPLILYAALFVFAIMLSHSPSPVLFGIAFVLLLLVLVCIHNAWDSVTYITTEESQTNKKR